MFVISFKNKINVLNNKHWYAFASFGELDYSIFSIEEIR